VPTLWIPSGDTGDVSESATPATGSAVAANELYRLCDDIHKNIQLKVQSNLSQLSKDCEAITDVINKELTVTKVCVTVRHSVCVSGAASCALTSCGCRVQ
jgi:hypothetical protein